MCEFCTQHGEGKKWYLQAKNYSEELLNEERRRHIREFFSRGTPDTAVAVDKLRVSDPAAYEALVPVVVEQQKKNDWGQVVPIEEVDQILDMSISVVRMACVCRSASRGFREARYCFGLIPSRSHFRLTGDTMHPDFSSDLEQLTGEEAKKAMRKLDRLGLVHTVWTHGPPLVFALCNCTSNECGALRARTRLGMPMFFKAEYVASIDWEECNGCRDCMKLCDFGAINYSAYADKCSINQLQCYGCGVCRAECPRDAISLRDRNAIPALANEW